MKSLSLVLPGLNPQDRLLRAPPTPPTDAAPMPPRCPPDGSGERLAAGSGPRAAQRPPGSNFGAIVEPFWSHFGTSLASIFDPPALHFGTSVVTSFRHVCSLCFSSFYSALRSNQAATKQASQASQASKQAKQAFFCRQPLATKRLASKRWSAVLAEP